MTFSERAVEAVATELETALHEHADTPEGSRNIARRVLTAALAVDGLALVPKEPTYEMGEAGIASLGNDDDRPAAQVVSEVWTAMLTAASDGEVGPRPPHEQR